jgi:hypothetical protein
VVRSTVRTAESTGSQVLDLKMFLKELDILVSLFSSCLSLGLGLLLLLLSI